MIQRRSSIVNVVSADRRRTAAAGVLLLVVLTALMLSCAAGVLARTPATEQAKARSLGPPKQIDVTVAREAEGFALRPYVEEGTSSKADGGRKEPSAPVIVLPLPPARDHLRQVDLVLTVTRRDDGTVANQQRSVFSRYTTGDELTFYVPLLAGGLYDAEIRAIARVDVVGPDGKIAVVERQDRAVLEVGSSGPPPQRREPYKVVFYFPKGAAMPAADQRLENERAVKLLLFYLERRPLEARIDCWASKEGTATLNYRLSQARCGWVRTAIWDGRLRDRDRPRLSAASAHGADDPPEKEPAGAASDKIEEARRKNRVAVLTLYLPE